MPHATCCMPLHKSVFFCQCLRKRGEGKRGGGKGPGALRTSQQEGGKSRLAGEMEEQERAGSFKVAEGGCAETKAGL